MHSQLFWFGFLKTLLEEKIGQHFMPIEYKEADKDLQFGPTSRGARGSRVCLMMRSDSKVELLNSCEHGKQEEYDFQAFSRCFGSLRLLFYAIWRSIKDSAWRNQNSICYAMRYFARRNHRPLLPKSPPPMVMWWWLSEVTSCKPKAGHCQDKQNMANLEMSPRHERWKYIFLPS